MENVEKLETLQNKQWDLEISIEKSYESLVKSWENLSIKQKIRKIDEISQKLKKCSRVREIAQNLR